VRKLDAVHPAFWRPHAELQIVESRDEVPASSTRRSARVASVRVLFRDLAVRAFFRHCAVRRAMSVACTDGPDLADLALYKDSAVGPGQPDEAPLLYGVIRTIRPETVVELGFLPRPQCSELPARARP